jgi:molecular chaperone GrpE
MAEADSNKPNDEPEIDATEQPVPETPISPQAPQRQPISITITDIELEQLKKDVAECKDKYQRALAEAENARKRMQKERQELIQYALQNILVDFLNPIDHLENALQFTQQASDDVKHWAIGFQMILNQFKEVLSNNGAMPFESEGAHFDPLKHEAIEMVQTNEYSPGTIVAETLRGYKMNNRTIRPAKVKVAKAIPSKKEEGSNEDKDKNMEKQSNSKN